jgi:hypothetical protein
MFSRKETGEDWLNQFIPMFHQVLDTHSISTNIKAYRLLNIFTKDLNTRSNCFSGYVGGEATLLYFCLHMMKITAPRTPAYELYGELILQMLQLQGLDLYLQYVIDAHHQRKHAFEIACEIESPEITRKLIDIAKKENLLGLDYMMLMVDKYVKKEPLKLALRHYVMTSGDEGSLASAAIYQPSSASVPRNALDLSLLSSIKSFGFHSNSLRISASKGLANKINPIKIRASELRGDPPLVEVIEYSGPFIDGVCDEYPNDVYTCKLGCEFYVITAQIPALENKKVSVRLYDDQVVLGIAGHPLTKHAWVGLAIKDNVEMISNHLKLGYSKNNNTPW